WLWWRFATAVAVAAVVVLAVVATLWGPVDPARTLTATVMPNATTTMAALNGRPYTPMNDGRRFQPLVVRQFQPLNVGRPFQGRLLEPEVLIDARESAALRALILGTREGRVDLEPVVRASTPTAMDLPPVGAIDIPFLTIDPI